MNRKAARSKGVNADVTPFREMTKNPDQMQKTATALTLPMMKLR